jgi:hypothetical protein
LGGFGKVTLGVDYERKVVDAGRGGRLRRLFLAEQLKVDHLFAGYGGCEIPTVACDGKKEEHVEILKKSNIMK